MGHWCSLTGGSSVSMPTLALRPLALLWLAWFLGPSLPSPSSSGTGACGRRQTLPFLGVDFRGFDLFVIRFVVTDPSCLRKEVLVAAWWDTEEAGKCLALLFQATAHGVLHFIRSWCCVLICDT